MPMQLHITHGDGFSTKLIESGLVNESDIVTWRDLICEGPCSYHVGTESFILERKKFLKQAYQITYKNYEENFLPEWEKLLNSKPDTVFVLWLDYDLFSHLSQLSVIQLLVEKHQQPEIYIAGPGVITETTHATQKLTAFSSLSTKKLHGFLDQKQRLNADDLEYADTIWQYYCGNNPMKLKPDFKHPESFHFLAHCLQAHLERFPHVKSGLSAIETNVLKLIVNHQITSQKQLLGYAMEYQGYYGYDSIQLSSVLKRMKPFYYDSGAKIKLTAAGKLALEEKQSFYRELQNDTQFGGARKYDFLYNPATKSLHKL